MTPSEQARADHPCDACGGSGDRFLDRNQIEIPEGQECGAKEGGLICGAPAEWRDVTKDPGDGGFYRHGDPDAYLCERHMMEVETPAGPEEGELCPVCQGSGRISDVMPAADAMADAETVRLAAKRRPGLRSDVRHASYYGARVLDYTCDRDDIGDVDPADVAAGYAQTAARAAFRAIPGLRGNR
jgi:hypothetical protein